MFRVVVLLESEPGVGGDGVFRVMCSIITGMFPGSNPGINPLWSEVVYGAKRNSTGTVLRSSLRSTPKPTAWRVDLRWRSPRC